MEDSERIFKELEGLEGTRDGIEGRWQAANNAPELRELVQKLLVAERIDPVGAETLQRELTEKLKDRDKEKDAYLLEWKVLRKELDLLTRDVIISFIRQISEEVASLGKRRINEIIKKQFHGFSGTTMLTVRSNDERMEEIRKLGIEAISRIQGMHAVSIPMIQADGKKLLEGIKQVDLSKTSEKEIDEALYYRFQTPQGIGAGTKDYSGPLSSLRR